jgi:uncharacterized protein (TIGR03437 family)
MKVFRFVGLVLLAAASAPGQSVSTIVNDASNILGPITTTTTTVAGLPNSGIAQGSILIVYGAGLGPATLVSAPVPFQSTNVGGVSMAVTAANGQIINVPMYYASATQLAGLLPSSTPLGAATLTVTYDGLPSNAQPFTVVQNNLGIYTVSANGQGVGAVTYPDFSLVTNTKAANPGDTLTLWATGLGPVTGNELGGAGLGVNMGNIALTLWLGGVQANVTYQGRSGSYIGEDQINFVVPNGVPTGCAVPLMVQIGLTNQITNNTVMISNNVVIPVASGSRTCTPANSTFSPAVVQQLSSGTPFAFGQISVARNISSSTQFGNGLIYEDDGTGQFGAYTVAPNFQPFVTSYFDTQPLGTCVIYSSVNGKAPPPPSDVSVAGLDAGVITVASPTTAPTALLETQNTGYVTDYFLTFSPANPGTFLSQRGVFTVAGAGGRDIGKFSANFTIGTIPSWTNQTAFAPKGTFTATRQNGATLTWSATAAPADSGIAYIEIDGASYTDGNIQNAALFSCLAPATAGTFTVPPAVLAALPPGPYFELEFKPVLTPVTFTASGLGLGSVSVNYLTVSFGTLQ